MGRKKKENKPKPNKDKVRIVLSNIKRTYNTKLINKFINLMEKLWQK